MSRLSYRGNNVPLMFRKNSFKNSRKSHQSVTKKMYDKFRKYNNKWLKSNGIATDCLDDILLGNSLSIKSLRAKENYLKKTPYHVYYKYKSDCRIINNTTTATTTPGTSNNNKRNINSLVKKSSSSDTTSDETPTVLSIEKTEISNDKK